MTCSLHWAQIRFLGTQQEVDGIRALIKNVITNGACGYTRAPTQDFGLGFLCLAVAYYELRGYSSCDGSKTQVASYVTE